MFWEAEASLFYRKISISIYSPLLLLISASPCRLCPSDISNNVLVKYSYLKLLRVSARLFQSLHIN